MIALRGVSFEVDSRLLLDTLELSLEEPRIGVIGANGSGKSTFARLLNGLLLPTRGRVLVDGLDTRTDGAAVRRRVGFVFQNPDNQIVYPTVAEDLAFGLKNLGTERDVIADRVRETLIECGLEGFDDRLVHQLSGGEKQLVAIAGVLAMRPDILVLDEPTTLLDLRNARRVANLVEGLEQQVIMVTHDLDLIKGYDRVICFNQGRVLCDLEPDLAVQRYRDLLA